MMQNKQIQSMDVIENFFAAPAAPAEAPSPPPPAKPAPPTPEGGEKKFSTVLGKAESREAVATPSRFAPTLLAMALVVLRHHDVALSLRVRWFSDAMIALVVQCIEDMAGDDASKTEHLKRVVDLAIADCAKHGQEPSVRYIFGDLQHFRRRLRRLEPSPASSGPVVDEALAARFNRLFVFNIERLRAALGGAEDPAVALRRGQEILARVTDLALVETWSALAARVPAATTPVLPTTMPQNEPEPVGRATPPLAGSLSSAASQEGTERAISATPSVVNAPSREAWFARRAAERADLRREREREDAEVRARRDAQLAEIRRLVEADEQEARREPATAVATRELANVAEEIRAELAELGGGNPHVRATLAKYASHGPALAATRPALMERALAAS